MFGNVVFATCLIQPAGGATIAGVAGSSFISGLPFSVAVDNAGSYASENITFAGGVLANGSNMFVCTSFAATAQGLVFSVIYFK